MSNNYFGLAAAVMVIIVLVVVGAYALMGRDPVVASDYPSSRVSAPITYVSGPPYYVERTVTPIVVRQPTVAVPPPVVTPPPSDEPMFCTMDAKMCPDGSYVGRVPPTCQFASCPST